MTQVQPGFLSVGLLVLPALLVLTVGRRRLGSDWAHPAVFASLYVSFVCLAPMTYVATTGRSLGVLTAPLVTPKALLALQLFSLSFLAGALTRMSRDAPASPLRAVRTSSGPKVGAYVDWRRVRALGTLALFAATAIRLYETTRPRVRYGENQFDFTATTALGTATDLVVLPAVIAVVLANQNTPGRHRRVLGPLALSLLAIFAAGSLYTGQRSPLLAPLLFLAFAAHRWRRPIRLWVALPALSAAIIVFNYAGDARAGRVSTFTLRGTLESTLQALSSVGYVTAETVAALDAQAHPFTGPHFLEGATYLASLLSLAPGLIVRALNGGQPLDTGAFYFRKLINFDNPNQGYSYSTPAEAYLNFGLFGTVTVGFALGALLAWAHSRATRPTSVRAVIYPVLLALTPYGLRSDALTHMKTFIYTILIVTVFVWLSRRPGQQPGASQPAGRRTSSAVDEVDADRTALHPPH